jgi:thioredoxin 1
MTGLLKTLFGKSEDSAPGTGAAAVDAIEVVDTAAPVSLAEPVHVTDETFSEMVLNSSLPVLVDFWAPWCGPCRMVAPVVEELAESYHGRAVIAKVNTDENVQIASQLGIMGIPTLVVFKDGQEVDRVVGYAPQRVLEEKLNAALN